LGDLKLEKIDDFDVAVIIPTLNEEKNIGNVILELKKIGYNNILIIDGNSQDKTIEVAKEHDVNIIVQDKMGKGAALRQAFNHSGLNGQAIVMMDADGSMNPKEIPLLIRSLNSNADLVKGSRFLLSGYSEDMNLIRRIGNQFFVLLVNLFWSTDYTDLCYGFAAFRRTALEKLRLHLKSSSFEIETEVFIKAKKLGLTIVETPSIELRRRHGKSNLRIFRDGFRILRVIIEELVNRDMTKKCNRYLT